LTYNVLVVDDFEPWRRRIAAELSKSQRWRVVAECADGPDAVREAAERKPDLIILDIALKSMNGVEAARRILADNPRARILFITGQHSPDIAEAALATGARGYLLKPEAGGALLRAVEAVAAGAQFISPGLPSDLGDATNARVDAHRHAAVFHSLETALVDEYARFAEHALERGRPVVVVAPRSCLESVHARLEARGVPVSGAIDEGRLQMCDVEPEVARLTLPGAYDRERVREFAAAILGDGTTSAPGQRAAVCGELAPHLWKQERADTALDMERVWDAAVRVSGADLLCGYCVDAARLADDGYSVFREICALHETTQVR